MSNTSALPMPPEAKNLYQVPNLLLQKFTAPEFAATVHLTFTANQDGTRAGLIVFGDDYACLSIALKDKQLRCLQTVCRAAATGGGEQIIQAVPLETPTVRLRVTVAAPDAQCTFSYSTNGTHFEPIGGCFTAKPGRWVGAKVGLFCVSDSAIAAGGFADIAAFDIEKH